MPECGGVSGGGGGGGGVSTFLGGDKAQAVAWLIQTTDVVSCRVERKGGSSDEQVCRGPPALAAHVGIDRQLGRAEMEPRTRAWERQEGARVECCG